MNETGGFGKFAVNDIVEQAANLQPALAIIEQMRGGSSHRFPYGQLHKFIDALMRDLPFMGYPLKEFTLYRGRITPQLTLFENASEFSYRPLTRGTSWGRCNRPDTTVFYGSMNMDTVTSELSPDIGDYIQIGAVKNDDIELTVSAIGEIDHIRRFGRPLVGSPETTLALKSLFKTRNSDYRLRCWLVDAFFAEIFANRAYRNKEYKITAALAESLMSAPTIDGFAYPSVAHRGGMNVAVKPATFDKKFRWQGFRAYRVADSLGFGIYGYQLVATADAPAEDGSISWNRVDDGPAAAGETGPAPKYRA